MSNLLLLPVCALILLLERLFSLGGGIHKACQVLGVYQPNAKNSTVQKLLLKCLSCVYVCVCGVAINKAFC